MAVAVAAIAIPTLVECYKGLLLIAANMENLADARVLREVYTEQALEDAWQLYELVDVILENIEDLDEDEQIDFAREVATMISISADFRKKYLRQVKKVLGV